VVATVAIRGEGLHELVEQAVEIAGKYQKPKPLEYGAEVENRIRILSDYIDSKN